MKFEKKSQWQSYVLKQLGRNFGGYAFVKYNGNPTQLLYFVKHDFHGEPWVLESPCVLHHFSMEDNAYEIDAPQISPFLPDEIEMVEWLGSDETHALEYLLRQHEEFA